VSSQLTSEQRGALHAEFAGVAAVNEAQPLAEGEAASPSRRRGLVDGGAFILDQPTEIPAVWGRGGAIAISEGEPAMIAGPPGVGKSTLAQNFCLHRVGLRDGNLLGLPVTQSAGRLLYVAADRPAQIARSFRRMIHETDRKALNERILVWRGPLNFDLALEPHKLAELAKASNADTIVLDSLKDVALDLTKDETGSRVNLALQHAVAEGILPISLHHQRKASGDNKAPRTLSDVYGSAWLTAGQGSVLLVWGEAGDPIVELRHLKQPADDIGPLRLMHEATTGAMSLHQPTDLLAMVNSALSGGLTVAEAACELFSTTSPSDVDREKARRRLNDLVGRGHARKISASDGGPSRYRPIERQVGP